MKLATWGARVAVTCELLVLVAAHAAWAWVYADVGFKPTYGHPESWSNPPLSDHPYILYKPFLYLFIYTCLLPVGPTAALFLMVQAARRWRERKLLVWGALGMVITVLVFVDPFGAVNWYMD